MMVEFVRHSVEDGPQTRFTVATVCINAESTIERCVRSVVAQAAPNGPAIDFEYLVIDGGSSDSTLDLIMEHGRPLGKRLRLVTEPDEGIYDAMNKALHLSCGDYIVYVNADDWLEDGALLAVTKAIDHVVERGGSLPDVVAGSMRVHAPDGATSLRSPEPQQVERRHPSHMPAGHQAMFVRTEVMRAVGGFKTRFGIAADYDLALRLIESGVSWLFLDDVLADFSLGGASYRILPTAREYREVRLANGFPVSLAWALYVRNVAASLVARF